MSVKSEESDRQFRKWKEDIQRRCEEWLKDHPEYKPLTSDTSKSKNLLVEVLQDEVAANVWFVKVNGRIDILFIGSRAQSMAQRYAQKVIDEKS